MARGVILNRSHLGPRGGAITAGVYMAMAMAASTQTVSAFSTKTSTIATNSQRTPLLPQASIDLHSSYAHKLHPTSTLASHNRYKRFFATIQEEDCGCDEAALESGNELFGSNIGSQLRETVLTTVDGSSVKLGKYIGDAENDTTIVVFLRHLA